MANLIDYNVEYYQRVKEHIMKRIVSKSEELSRGACANYAEYKAVSGQIEGLREALQILGFVSDEMIKEDGE